MTAQQERTDTSEPYRSRTSENPPYVRLPLGSRGCRGDARALRSPAWCSITSGSCGPPRRSTAARTPAVPHRPAHRASHGFPKPRDPQRRRTTPSTPRHRDPENPGPPGTPDPLPLFEGYSRGCVHEGLSGAGLTNWPDFVVRSAASTPDAGVRANVRAHVSGNSRTQPLKCQGSCQGIGRPRRASFGVNNAGP